MELTPGAYRFEEDHRSYASMNGQDGDGWKSQFRSDDVGDGCRVGVVDCVITESQAHRVEGPPTFSVSLFLEGDGCFEFEDGPLIEFRSGSMFLFHTNGLTRGLDRVNGNSRLRGAEFRFSLPIVERIGLIGGTQAHALPNAIPTSENVVLFLHHRLTGDLRHIAEQVLACRLEGLARRLFLRAKALEVLAQVVSMHERARAGAEDVSGNDRRRIEAAARLLRERPEEPWTISRLALESGLNERKLKHGFRLVLGQTVLGVLENARVEAAQRLFRQECLNVAEAALAVGYSNPSHFAKIFRRVVGVAPGDWRKQLS